MSVVVGLGAAACADEGPAADGETARYAAVQAEHLCAVASTNFPTEEAIREELDALLAKSGLAFEGYKAWHDTLTESSARAEQLAEATSAPCP